MREILFRGKQIDNRAWVYGVPCEFGIEVMIVKGLFDCGEYDCIGADKTTIDKETLGQYTELTDKNGNKIFEGDIVSFAIFDYEDNDTQYKGVIKWVDAGFYIYKDNGNDYFGSDGVFNFADVYYQDDEFEVIGNIYDNPELLRSDTE